MRENVMRYRHNEQHDEASDQEFHVGLLARERQYAN